MKPHNVLHGTEQGTKTTFHHTSQYTASLEMVCKHLKEYLTWCHSFMSKEMLFIIYRNCETVKATLIFFKETKDSANQCDGQVSIEHVPATAHLSSSYPGKIRPVAKVGTQLKDYALKVGYKYDRTMLKWSHANLTKTLSLQCWSVCLCCVILEPIYLGFQKSVICLSPIRGLQVSADIRCKCSSITECSTSVRVPSSSLVYLSFPSVNVCV